MKKLKEKHKADIQKILTKHVGRRRAIGAEYLALEVFGAGVREHPERYKRRLRGLVALLRNEGAAIASHSDSGGGGYYLMVGSERDDYAETLKRAALGKLVIASKVMDISVGNLLEAMLDNLKGGTGESA